MKMKKYILGLALLAGALFTSCDKDNEGAIYNVYTPNVSFEKKSVDVITANPSAEVTIKLTRFGKSGQYTVHYTGSSEDEGIFTDVSNGEATFADGSSYAYLTIKADNMEIGEEYTYSIAMSEADIETADTIIGKPIADMTITIKRDYTWTKLGSGVFSSPDMMETSWAQEIYQAEENTEVYKLPDCYAKGYDLQLIIKDDGTVIVPIQIGWTYTGYGPVYVGGNANDDFYTDGSGVAGVYDKTAGTITMAIEHYLAAMQYPFGTGVDTFTFGE